MVKYGLIGKNLDHSFSPEFFRQKFERENIDAEYNLYSISTIDQLPVIIGCNNNVKGLNVTIPYKESVIPFLDCISDDALSIGAVNTIKIVRPNLSIEQNKYQDNNFTLLGFNTDYKAFLESIEPILNNNIKSGLILGTGGASKAVAYALKSMGINVTFVSRNYKNHSISYSNLNEHIIKENLLIVNTTPLGMYPKSHNCPDIPYEFLTKHHICYDLIYNPEETLFLKKSQEKGAIIKNGFQMLKRQAELSYDIWNS